MKRIGITQRVVEVPGRSERRDVLDQRWYEFAEQVGIFLIPIPNALHHPDKYIEKLEMDGIIFSGGNNVGYEKDRLVEGKTLEEDDVAVERDRTEALLLEWAMDNNKPLIGVCRGLQFIHCYFGGALTPVDAKKHVAVNHAVHFPDRQSLDIYGGQEQFNSYHDWGVDQDELASSMHLLGTTGNTVEMFKHSDKNIWGIMWHPERYEEFTEGDITLFRKVFKV